MSVAAAGRLDRAALLEDLRANVFAAPAPAAPPRIGAEVEWLLLRADTGAPALLDAPDGSGVLPPLRRHAAGAGWVEEPTPYGAPRFHLPDGGCLFFEPGGQLELSTAPCRSGSELLASLRRTFFPLRDLLRAHGFEPLAAGIDPLNPLERAPLQLGGERYTRMAAHLARGGAAGGRMMRQTAAFQLNLDFGDDAARRWRVLNAAAPFLLAIFANSPRYAGRATGHRSFRAACWRALDPQRTGLFGREADAAAEYLAFALAAPSILPCSPDGAPPPPFEACLDRGADLADWRAHLSTLFPEVRPKGYLELRSLDAVEPEWWAAPIALVGGILYDGAALREAEALLGAPDPALLAPAGERGVADPRIGPVAERLWEIALPGAERLGEGFLTAADRADARDFADRYTLRRRAPADDADPAPDAPPLPPG